MTAKRSTRSDEYKSVFGNGKKGGDPGGKGASWSEADCKLILQLIDTVSSRGGAIRFGYTRDGGAYALGLYYGNDHETVYCRPGEDLHAFIQEWVEFYSELPYSGGKSPQ